MLQVVISGGQTGVDSGALKAAQDSAIHTGGWCPPGHLRSDGRIPGRFPLVETFTERSPDAPDVPRSLRTQWNVRDSDGTLILRPREFFWKRPPVPTDWSKELDTVERQKMQNKPAFPEEKHDADPGTDWTAACAVKYGRPLMIGGLGEALDADTVMKVAQWVNVLSIRVLNVAGPKEDDLIKRPVENQAYNLLIAVFRTLANPY